MVAAIEIFQTAFLALCLNRLSDLVNSVFSMSNRGVYPPKNISRGLHLEFRKKLKLYNRIHISTGPEARQITGPATPSQLKNFTLYQHLQEIHHDNVHVSTTAHCCRWTPCPRPSAIHGVAVEQLGAPYRALRAFVLFFSLKRLNWDPPHFFKIFPSVILHHLYSRGPKIYSHPLQRNKLTPLQYSLWMDSQGEDQIWKGVKVTLDDYAARIEITWERRNPVKFNPLMKISKHEKRQELNSLIKILRPKVYITNTSNFKTLVQQLTGNGNYSPLSSPPPSTSVSQSPPSLLRDQQIRIMLMIKKTASVTYYCSMIRFVFQHPIEAHHQI
ncbi:hypothetical protein DH2020_022629 [Rehmannia glutinosa]|uniref:VQ domain-containing protein n=1 Tax=Rehmannia glutinosa TaxID=99300 RepID=A0ABR0W3P8_REHGL